jgi:hypothetical protein
MAWAQWATVVATVGKEKLNEVLKLVATGLWPLSIALIFANGGTAHRAVVTTAF